METQCKTVGCGARGGPWIEHLHGGLGTFADGALIEYVCDDCRIAGGKLEATIARERDEAV